MKAISEDAGIKWEKVFSYPGMGDCLDDEAFDLIRDVLPEVSGKVSYGSEGGIFEKVGGLPAIICGPGNIEQAHQPNEYVEIDQLDKCLAFLRNVVDAVEKKHANED
jgi:acetylornithine deacetylase